jgi:hypothetical protein
MEETARRAIFHRATDLMTTIEDPVLMPDQTRTHERQELPAPDDSALWSGLDDDLRARVKAELEPGERPLWASMAYLKATPLGPKFFLGSMAAPALIVLAYCAIANGLGHLGPPPRANDAAPIVLGIVAFMFALMLAAGLSIRATNGWAERRRMSKTCYAVTDRRAILWIPDPKTGAVRVISVLRGQIDGVVRAELPDGSGDLEIACDQYLGHCPWYPFGFRNVPDVRRVEQIVRTNLIVDGWPKKRRERDFQ